MLSSIFGVLFRRVESYLQLKQEFKGYKNGILYNSVTNELPVLLNAFRIFLIKHNLISKPKFAIFYNKWLDHPRVILNAPVANGFTAQETMRLKTEIAALSV